MMDRSFDLATMARSTPGIGALMASVTDTPDAKPDGDHRHAGETVRYAAQIMPRIVPMLR